MKSYILQNWTMLLVLAAFAIALYITVFMDKKTVRRMYVLIVAVFLLSVTVFLEFGYADAPEHRTLRVVLMAIRYSAATLALCFTRSLKPRESGYRIGGDEFAIVCRHTSEGELSELVNRIQSRVEETQYSCSIGYSYNEDGRKTVEEMLKEADDMMYANKARYYKKSGRDRRRR